MELFPNRDLIQDELGNYYEIKSMSGRKITLVNAFVHYSFRRIMNEDFLHTVKDQYEESVGVGQFFADMLKNRISMLTSGKVPGGIYSLSEVEKYYEIEVNPLYERSIGITK